MKHGLVSIAFAKNQRALSQAHNQSGMYLAIHYQPVFISTE